MKTNILAIGTNDGIMEVVVRLINNNENWNGIGALTKEEAIDTFNQDKFDIILLCSGLKEQEEEELRNYFTTKTPGIIIIQHYGGGSGLLSNEIFEALDNKAKDFTA